MKRRHFASLGAVLVGLAALAGASAIAQMRMPSAMAAAAIVPATPEKAREAEFIMLCEGNIVFEGDADALRSSKDPYIQTFLD